MKNLKIQSLNPTLSSTTLLSYGKTFLITCDCNEMQSAERDKFTWVQK